MSALQKVLAKYQSALAPDLQNQQKASAGSAGTDLRHLKSSADPSAGSAGTELRHFKSCDGSLTSESVLSDRDASTFETPKPRTCGTSESPSAGSAGSKERHLKSLSAASAAELERFRAALILSRLVICANCARFRPSEDPDAFGQCDLHGEAHPFTPFDCPQFSASPKALAPDYLPDPDASRAFARCLGGVPILTSIKRHE